MPGCDLDQGAAIAEKISRTIETQCAAEVSGLRVTVSIGVASLGSRGAGIAELIEEADRALYDAKSSGRNRVACAPLPGHRDNSRGVGMRA
jgi:diguanylate cyclase (GGDEF)-like protein